MVCSQISDYVQTLKNAWAITKSTYGMLQKEECGMEYEKLIHMYYSQIQSLVFYIKACVTLQFTSSLCCTKCILSSACYPFSCCFIFRSIPHSFFYHTVPTISFVFKASNRSIGVPSNYLFVFALCCSQQVLEVQNLSGQF